MLPHDPAESTAQENELFRTAFERSAVGMAHLSTTGIFLRVNARLCEMTGYAPAELTGMHFREITLEEDFGPVDESRRLRIAREGGSYSVERRYLRKNGEIFWVHITTTMLRDGQDEAKYGMSVIEDITQRKLAELRLQRLNRLHGVVSKISESTARADDRQALFALACRIAVQRGGLRLALIVETDATSGALHGVAARESGEGATTLDGVDAAIASSGVIGDAVRGGQRAVCVTRSVTPPDEDWQAMAVRKGIGATGCFPLLVGGAAIGALIVAATEVDYFREDEVDLLSAVANCLSLTVERLEAEHRRRLAEEQVRRQASMLASAGRLAGIGSWELDLKSGRLEVSDDAVRIFGFDRAAFDGTSAAFLGIVHPDDREAVLARLISAPSGRTEEMEYRIVRPDGEERVILGRGAVVDSLGEPSRFRVGMVMDVTERKRAEEEFKRSLQIEAGVARIQQEMVASQGDPQAMTDLMAARACELTGATGAAIMVVDGTDVIHRSASGTTIGARGLRLPLAATLVGLSIERDELLVCDDSETDPRANAAVFREYGVRSMMSAPLRVGAAVTAALVVVGKRPQAFTPRDASTLQILAQWMGASMERNAAAEQLRASAAQYQLVFAASPLPMWVYDVQTLRFLAVNDAALAKYGYSKAEFLALTIRDISPAEALPALEEQLIAGDLGSAAGTTWQHRTQAGTVLDVEVSSSAIDFGERPARLVLAHDITERRHAERQLQKSEAILAIAGRVAHVAGWSYDLKNRVFEFSDELWALHEVPRGSAVSLKEAIAFYAPESRPAMIDAVNRCANDGTPYDLELEIITARGRRIGVRTIGEAVRDSTGKIVGTQGAVQDISERKLAADQLQALAARLTRTLESITDGFYTLDPEWRFTYVNTEAERFLRHSRGELIGRTLWEMFPTTSGSELERRFRTAVAERKSVEFEIHLREQHLWMELHVYPSEAGLTVYGRDVTQRHQAEEQLKLLEACVAHMNEVLIVAEVDPDGRSGPIVFVNDAFVRLTGYDRDEALGRSPRMLHGALTSEAERDRMLRALNAGEKARGELILYRKDGSTYWVELELVPLRSAGGRITHRIGVQRDTTERRQAQEALGALNETLESRVVERTAALELARHDAEQASRAKSAFVATMSHEIRTPMNGVIGMLDVLEQSELAAEQSKMLGLARESAHSLMAVIEDILDFSKIEAGKVELERVSVSVSGIVESVCAMVADGARSKGVEVVGRVDAGLSGAVWGDPVRLRQVLVNLISNAIKFSARSGGGGRVAVSAKRLERKPGGITVELAVEDNGIGMAEATIGDLFRPFAQADASTTRRFGGTGLGLTITRHLVDLMAGQIVVTSQPEVGSVFLVRLPFDLVDSAEGTRADAPAPRPAAAAPRPARVMHPGMLLIAEDNFINQKVIAAQLKLLGFTAEIACNGQEALVLWRTGRFAALLTDLQMPEMDGYDLAASIRREEGSGARMPIIALTANAVKQEADLCRAAGMDDFLTKPATLTDLEAMLERHLGKAVAAGC